MANTLIFHAEQMCPLDTDTSAWKTSTQIANAWKTSTQIANTISDAYGDGRTDGQW